MHFVSVLHTCYRVLCARWRDFNKTNLLFSRFHAFHVHDSRSRIHERHRNINGSFQIANRNLGIETCTYALGRIYEDNTRYTSYAGGGHPFSHWPQPTLLNCVSWNKPLRHCAIHPSKYVVPMLADTVCKRMALGTRYCINFESECKTKPKPNSRHSFRIHLYAWRDCTVSACIGSRYFQWTDYRSTFYQFKCINAGVSWAAFCRTICMYIYYNR